MIFYDEQHEKFYNEKIEMIGANADAERKSLVYILGLTETTRVHFEEIYNQKGNVIRATKKMFNEPWQTGTSLALIRLAYNLYGGFVGVENDEANKYSVLNIFSSCRALIPYLYEAISIRFEMI